MLLLFSLWRLTMTYFCGLATTAMMAEASANLQIRQEKILAG